jgi:hypothetical protein
MENGWILYTVPGEGFEIALPPEWLQIDLNPEVFEASIAIAEELNPKMGGFLSSDTMNSMIASGIKFYGLDPSPETINHGMPASVNILIVDLGFELPLDTLVNLNLETLSSLANPEIPITNQRTLLSNIEAEKITYVTDMVGLGAEPVSLMIVQYVMLEGSEQWVISLGTPFEMANSYSDTFEQIAKSFQMLK